MKSRLITTGAIFLALTAALAVVLYFFAGLRMGISIATKETLDSPDGRFTAHAVIVDGGATTGFSPQVRLTPRGKSPRPEDNVFVGYHSDLVFVEWPTTNQMVIHSPSDVFLLVTNKFGIAIELKQQ